MKVSSMSELKEKKKTFLPSPHKATQSMLDKRIKCLKEILVDCDTISVKRGELYLKLIELDLVGTTREVEDPKLILNSIFMSKEKFEEKLEY
jgi:hypothetical protein